MFPSHPRTAANAAPVAFTPSARSVGFSERDSDQVLETASVPEASFIGLGFDSHGLIGLSADCNENRNGLRPA